MTDKNNFKTQKKVKLEALLPDSFIEEIEPKEKIDLLDKNATQEVKDVEISF